MVSIIKLTRSVAGFLSFQLIFTVNLAHKNYKLYSPYSEFIFDVVKLKNTSTVKSKISQKAKIQLNF